MLIVQPADDAVSVVVPVRVAPGSTARAPEISGTAVKSKWIVAAVWIALAFIARTAVAYWVPLLPDETYYWQWSRHLEAGYFDHPPGIALLISAGTAIFGDTTFGVRAGPAFAAVVAHVGIVGLAARLGGARGAARAACIAALLPFATLGLVLATPDAPLMACTVLALLFLERALRATPTSEASFAWWIATGVAMGGALLSKYTAALLPISFAMACLLYKPLRARLLEPGPWVASCIALFLFLPVLAWNALTDWVSFRFQFEHGFGAAARGTPVSRVLELVSGQLGIATPIIGVLLFLAVLLTLRHEWRTRTQTRATDKAAIRFALAIAAIIPLLFFVYSALRRPIEPNWPALSYPAAIVLLATSWSAWARSRWWKWGISVGAVLLLAFIAQAWKPIAPVAPARDPIARAHGWSSLATAVDLARRDSFLNGTNAQWVAAERYQDASELAFNLRDQPEVFSLNLRGRANQYDLWDSAVQSLHTHDGLVAAFDATPAGDTLAMEVAQWFESSKRGVTVQLQRGGETVGERRVWLFRNARYLPASNNRLQASALRR